MSDVFGTPYMGNFSGNPFLGGGTGAGTMSAGQVSAPWAPETYGNQNVVNNLYSSGGGFGQQTNYYSGLGAQYSAAGMSPYGVFTDPGYGRGGGASPYQTTPNVWETGASPFQGGGGSSGFGGSIYDFGGGLGSLGASPYQTTPNVFDTGSRGFQFPGAGGIDWGGLAQAAQQQQPHAADFGAGMFGGLAGGLGGAYQGPNNAIDWSGLFGGGSGGARAAQPQQPPVNFGSLFGQGVGGSSADPLANLQPKSQAQPPFDFNGGNAGWGRAPTLPDAQRLVGYDPSQGFSAGGNAIGGSPFDTGAAPIVGTSGPQSGGVAGGIGGLDWGGLTGQTYQPPSEPNQFKTNGPPVTEAYNPYFGVTSPYSPRSGGEIQGGGGLTAADLGEQARARLAEVMAKGGGPATAETPKIPPPAVPPAEAPTERVPLPVARPAEANADPYAALPGAIPLPLGRTAESAREAGGPATSDAATGDIPLPRARPAEANAAESPATQVYPGANAPRPPADVFPAARLAPNGQEPELFVVHHTGGGSSPEAIVNSWRTERPGVGAQYIMDRNGVIHDTANEYGYTGTGHAKDLEMPGSGVSTKQTGVSNRSIVGMEIMAKNEKNVTPAQLAALTQFANTRYPNTPFYGHGEISTNRANDEGSRGVQAILQSRPPAFNFDWTNAPIPGPPNGRAAPPAAAPPPAVVERLGGDTAMRDRLAASMSAPSAAMANFQSPANSYGPFQQIARQPYDQYSDEPPLNPAGAGFATVRNNNPGAQYPGDIATMYGATGQQDLLGGKYKIATFDTPVAGAAANFENLSQNYVGKTVGDAISKWSGNLRSTIPGYPSSMVITPEMIRDPAFAIPFMRAIAGGEASGAYPMSERDWQKAHGMFTGNYP